MIIIGEKINGAITKTAEAVRTKGKAYIREMAIKQTEFGAHYIDVCAGTDPSIELETLKWLVDIVQDAVDTPICLDSSDCDILLETMNFVNKPGIINFVSEEHGKCDKMFPYLAGANWKIITLICDNTGISLDLQV